MPIGLKGDSGSIPLVAVLEKAKSLLLVKGEKKYDWETGIDKATYSRKG
jgi:hypothetical protein